MCQRRMRQGSPSSLMSFSIYIKAGSGSIANTPPPFLCSPAYLADADFIHHNAVTAANNDELARARLSPTVP